MNGSALRFLVGLSTVWFFCGPLQAAPKKPPQKDLTELRARIDKLKREIDSAEEDKADVLDGLKQSEQAISQINRGLHEMAQERQEVSTTLGTAQQQSKQTRARIQAQQNLLAKLLYQQYVNGSQDTMRLVLNLQNPNEITRQVAYYGYLSRSRATLITSLRNDLQEAEAAETVVKEKHAELVQIEAKQLSERRALQQEANTHKRTLSKLDRQIGDRRKQVAQLERDEKRLTRLLERLAQAMATKKSTAHKSGPRPNSASGDFTKLKGHLKLPVSGELSNRFGTKRSDTGTSWKGLFIRANTGSPVKALGPGQVVFADWLRGFGNLIIVDHGKHYFTIYAHLTDRFKSIGQPVQTDEVIGTAGTTDMDGRCGIYFEMRNRAKSIDCKPWFRGSIQGPISSSQGKEGS